MLYIFFNWTWPTQVWAGPLSGNRIVVALWNRCSEVSTISASWNVLGLQSATRVSVKDLWQVSKPSFMQFPLDSVSIPSFHIIGFLKEQLIFHVILWRFFHFILIKSACHKSFPLNSYFPIAMGYLWYFDCRIFKKYNESIQINDWSVKFPFIAKTLYN